MTKRPTYADTLETIAREGAGAFYSGRLANQTIDAIHKKGGVMTLEDLAGEGFCLSKMSGSDSD